MTRHGNLIADRQDLDVPLSPSLDAPACLKRRLLLLGGAFLILATIVIVSWRFPFADPNRTGDDLRIYRGAIDSMLHGNGLYTYAMALGTGPSPFLYPPFAALIMLPAQAVPVGSVETAWMLTQMVMTAALTFIMVRVTKWRGSLIVSAAAGALLFLSDPVMFGLSLGQISLLIMLLVLVDVAFLPKRWRGTLIGLAGGLKLTPMFFVPYFLITRQWRAAINASVAFAASAMIGFVAFPQESLRYWTSVVFKSSRIPNIASPRNLTIFGDLKMWHVPDNAQSVLWMVLAVSVAALAIWAAWRHYRAGEPVAAAIVIGLASTAIGPVAWDHHLVWLIIAGVYMALSSRKRVAAAGWALLVVSILPSPIWPHGETPVMWIQLAGMVPLLLTIGLSVVGLPRMVSADAPVRDLPHVLEV